MIQAAQWQSIFKSTGFSVEADVRIITDSEARVQAKRRVNPQQTLFCHHYVVVAWLGKRRIHNRGFGFLLPKQKRGYVFSGMPTCAPAMRLCDDTGCIVRPCEKHIAEPLEMIWTFFGATNAASATFCDFFSGSGVAGLAALRANFSRIILNDRDSKVKPFVESRMRHYLQWLTKDRGGEEWPAVGLELRGKGLKYSGISPYTFAQLEMKKATHDGELQLTLRSTPFDYKQEVFLHQNNLAIKPSDTIGGGHKGLFVTKGNKLPAGTEIPLFGRYMRQLKEGLNGRIVCVLLARINGDPKSLYLRIDDDCAGLFANDPAYADETSEIEPHGYIHEFEDRDICDCSRVCIVIETEVDATAEDTEIWVTYNLADVHEDSDDNNVGYGRTTLQRKSNKKKLKVDTMEAEHAEKNNDTVARRSSTRRKPKVVLEEVDEEEEEEFEGEDEIEEEEDESGASSGTETDS